MNVSCTSCSAKYAVPDEKVRGKKVKITCKHCGTGIIVDGTKPGAMSVAPAAPAAPAAAGAPRPAATPAVPVAAPSPAATPAAAAPAIDQEPRWDVAYPDDRQETLSASEIAEKYAQGSLDDDAFLWRDGMADWAAPFDIPELAAVLSARGLTRSVAVAAAAATPPLLEEDEATQVQRSPFEALSENRAVSGEWREPGKEAESAPEAAFDLKNPTPLPFQTAVASPKPSAATPKPAAARAAGAARRNEARGGGDLFGDLAGAGSEEDASLGEESREAGPNKMMGARNESSVLFSLDALLKAEQPAPKKAASKKDEAAAFLMGMDDAPSSLANVGTGSFGSAFAAPDFTAPVQAPPPEARRASEPVEVPSAAQQPREKGAGLWIALAAVVAAGGLAFALDLPGKLSATPEPAPSAVAAKLDASPTAAPAPEPVPATPASAAQASPSAAAGGSAPVTAPGAGGGQPASAATPVGALKPSDAAKPAAPGGSEPGSKPTDTATKPAEKPAEPAAAADAPPFDKGAAVASLTAAAGNAQSCKTAEGPTGSGKVSVTFMPSGRATNTQVSGDLAGTGVGGCVARIFRSAKIPAFAGEAVTVSKSFTVQ